MRFAALLFTVSFASLGGAAFAAPSPTPARDKSLAALLERARATSGAPYRYHIVSVSHESHGGRTFEVTTETDGLKYRARSCSKSICSGFYFDGERSFETNLNDTALPISARVDALQLTLRAIVSYAFTAPDFRSTGGQLIERDPISRDGRSYRRISIAPFRGALLDAIVEPTTGLVDGIISEERKYAFELKDERRVDGKLTLPYSISLNGSEFERFDSRKIERAPLEAPPGIAPALATDTAPVAMVRPERPSDQPVVPCSIGGQSALCLLDTGNSGLSISLELAEKLGLEPRSGAFDVSGVGSYVTGVVKAPPLVVGPATYPSALYIVLPDLRHYGYDVVLGADAFAHARITVGYAKAVVTFAAESADARAGALPIGFENFIPVLSIRIGDETVPLAVDTGDESAINLADDYYQLHRAIFRPSGSVPVAGIGGTSEEITGEVAHVRIGDFDVTRSRIGATKGALATARGHIGGGFLRHFDVTFDYGRARIELVPHPTDPNVSAD